MDGLVNYVMLCAVCFAAAAAIGFMCGFYLKRRKGYKPPSKGIGL